MKFYKILLAVFTFSLFIADTSGQSYWKTNGNSVNPTDFLGSTNNQDLRFRVNNFPRMRILNNSGFVGLGSFGFTPSAFLHINQMTQHNNSGNLIRTDGDSQLDLNWAMFSGTTVQTSNQKARLLLSPNTPTQNNNWHTDSYNDSINHLVVESTLSDVVFDAPGANSPSTNGVLTERMRITASPHVDPHWGTSPVSTTRVSISSRPGQTVTEPLAMLHIGDPWDYQHGGHRKWMNSGTYIQRHNDNVFFGMRPRENTTNPDANDAIIGWGDNDSPPYRLDALRFVFCAPYSGGASPGDAEHLNGLEVMRIHPEGNIGMGDFSVNGLNQMPTAKLDIDGTLRVRDVPNDTIPEVLLVGREADAVGDYFVNRLAFPGDNSLFLSGTGEWLPTSSTNGSDLDWEIGGNDVWTGLGTNGYPGGKVGIGTNGTFSHCKLHVYADKLTTSTQVIGIEVDVHPDSPPVPISEGIEIWTDGGSSDNIGTMTYIVGNTASRNTGHQVKFSASGNINRGFYADVNGGHNYNYGAELRTSDSNSSYNFGVYGHACNASRNYGVYGETCDDPASWAGFFDGDVYTTGTYTASDENLKQNIESIEDPIGILNLLNPKTYFYQDIPELTLNQNRQYGLLAQDVEEILPELIKQTIVPPESDSLGNILTEEFSFKAIRYNDFIPILIAGFQEQNATVTEQAAKIANQNEKIASLEDQLETQTGQLEELKNQMEDMAKSVQAIQAKTANCCNCNGKGTTGALNPAEGKELQLGQNIPNPFDTQTRIEFSLPEPAAVILEITDETGRPLERLIDTPMTKGSHSTVWDGSKYAPGAYFYTLYADGQLLTKKMIKR